LAVVSEGCFGVAECPKIIAEIHGQNVLSCSTTHHDSPECNSKITSRHNRAKFKGKTKPRFNRPFSAPLPVAIETHRPATNEVDDDFAQTNTGAPLFLNASSPLTLALHLNFKAIALTFIATTIRAHTAPTSLRTWHA